MLESKIIKEIAKLKKIQTSISHASTYFDQITKPLSENDPSSILNISNYGLLITCCSINIESNDFDNYLSTVERIKNDNFLEKQETFIQLLTLLKNKDNLELTFIKEYLIDLENGIESYEPIKEFTKKRNISYSEEIKTIWTIIALVEKEYNRKFEILKDLLDFIIMTKEENIDKYINSIKFQKRCPIGISIEGNKVKNLSKGEKEFLQEMQEPIVKKYNIDKLIEEILIKKEQTRKDKRKNYKKLELQINKLRELITFLDKTQTEFIKVEDFNFEEYSFYPDLLLEILKRNDKIYKDLKQENDSKNITTTKEIDKIFFKYQIPINSFKKEDLSSLLSNQTLEELEEKLSILTTSSLSFLIEEPSLLEILSKTKIEILKNMSLYYNLEKIDKNFIINNIDILTDINTYQKIIENIKILQTSKNIPEQVLKLDTEYLKQVITLAKSYNLDLTNKEILISLTNPYIFDYIDILIELNLIDILKIDQNFLNKDIINIIKRIIISKKINIEIINNNGKLNHMIKTGNNFYIEEKELDNYIENNVINFISTKSLEIFTTNKRFELSKPPKELEDFEENGNYLINGIIISKNKVLRNLKICDNLEESILFGSILGLNDILKIKEALKQKQK